MKCKECSEQTKSHLHKYCDKHILERKKMSTDRYNKKKSDNRRVFTAYKPTLEDIVKKYPTKSEYGFTQAELEELLKGYPNINMDKFNDAMVCNTCMIIDEQIIHYHCDVLSALRCGIENRNLTAEEWD